MKKIVLFLTLMFICSTTCYAQETTTLDELTALAETPAAGDTFYIKDGGDGGADKKIAYSNLMKFTALGVNLDTAGYEISDSTGNVVINDNVEITGSLIFTDSDGMTIDGDLTTTSDIIVNSDRRVDGKDMMTFVAKGTTAEVVSDYIYLDDNYFTNGFTATDIMISRDATADGAMSVSTVIGTWGKTGFTADSVVETITFGANDFTAEDDGTLTTSALTANKFLGIYTGTDAAERYNVTVTGYRK